MVSYGRVRDKLQTGDIILFSGKGGISHGIKLITNSKWSHVGMIVHLPDWDTVLLWESTTLANIADVEAKRELKGVQLVPLSERVRKYKGDVSVRFLEVERTSEMRKKLIEFRKKVKHRPYEESKIELIKAAYDGPFGANKEDLSSLFCSELVAEAYQRMGFLSEDKPSNEYTPKDFSDEGRLELIKGNLSEEQLISVE